MRQGREDEARQGSEDEARQQRGAASRSDRQPVGRAGGGPGRASLIAAQRTGSKKEHTHSAATNDSIRKSKEKKKHHSVNVVGVLPNQVMQARPAVALSPLPFRLCLAGRGAAPCSAPAAAALSGRAIRPPLTM